MRALSRSKLLSACLLAATLTVAGAGTAAAQAKLQQSPGGYHGELDFPIDWKRYYSYAEWTKILQDIQAKYPQLADIQSIGKSRMGRDQYLLTITAKSTGAHDTKPALWVDGAIHGNEVNGITCSLYVVWYLLTRYDYDPFVHELVDNTTFYVLPGFNVDANDSYVSFPNTANNPREPYRPEDDDGDGLYDEDQTEDVDGDGELSNMYVQDAYGPLKLSPDGRRFVPVAYDREPVQRFRLIGAEGFDNDGDGRINEDDIGGPDPNRNFAYGWTLEAGWPYPLSEPETRNVWEFQRTHPNIFITFNFHNTGRLIMFMAPNAVRPGTQPQAGPGGGGGGQQRPVAERLAELRRENKYAQLFDRQVAPEYQHDMDVQTKIVTAGARLLKDYRPTTSGLSGQHQATLYGHLGTYAYLMELWGAPIFADLDGDAQISDEELMAWIDMEMHGEGWINPHEVKHPDLGDIWIGGTQKKHMQRTPPSRYMEEEAHKITDFVLYTASQIPKVQIDRIRVTRETGDLYWVDVTVTNERIYPTSSDREVALGTAVKDKLRFRSGGGVRMLPIPSRAPQASPRDPGPRFASVGQDTHEFRLKGEDSQTFRYLVQGSETGWVELQVESFFGGKATKRITLREGM